MALLQGKQLAASAAANGLKKDGSGNLAIDAANGAAVNFSGTTVWTFPTTSLQVSGNPTFANDAVNKSYVDSVATGLDVKDSVQVATTENITLSGEQTIDGVLTSSSRILVKNQTTASENGIYITSSGAWTRSSDADADAEVTSGLFVLVVGGTTNEYTGWVLTTNDPITVGTTNLTFSQFSGVGTHTASLGVELVGNDFRLDLLSGGGLKLTGNEVGVEPADFAGTGLEDDGSDNLRLSTQGNGIAGGGGSTLSVDPATAVAGTRASVYVGADGVGIDLDGSTITHTGSTLAVADDGITAAKLASDVAGAGLLQNITSGAIDIVNATNGGITVNTDSIAVNINDLSTSTTIISGDLIAYEDVGTGTRNITIDNIVDFIAGTKTDTGLSDNAGVLTISAPTTADKVIAAVTTTANGDEATASGAAITQDPAANSYVAVYVNGMEQKVATTAASLATIVSNGVYDCYWSNDSGANSVAHGDITNTSTLHWVGGNAGFELATTDEISVHYIY